jgi:hypothetical protein
MPCPSAAGQQRHSAFPCPFVKQAQPAIPWCTLDITISVTGCCFGVKSHDIYVNLRQLNRKDARAGAAHIKNERSHRHFRTGGSPVTSSTCCGSGMPPDPQHGPLLRYLPISFRISLVYPRMPTLGYELQVDDAEPAAHGVSRSSDQKCTPTRPLAVA